MEKSTETNYIFYKNIKRRKKILNQRMRKHVHGDIDILKLVAKKCPYSP